MINKVFNNKKNIIYIRIFNIILFLFLINAKYISLAEESEKNTESPKKIRDAYSLENPYETICTHLSFLEKDNYRPYVSARAFMHEGVSIRDAKSYAIKLKEIYANEGIYINIDSVPQASDYQDPVEKYNKYRVTHIIPEIYLVKVGNKWLYSRETIHNIHRLYILNNNIKKRLINFMIFNYLHIIIVLYFTDKIIREFF